VLIGEKILLRRVSLAATLSAITIASPAGELNFKQSVASTAYAYQTERENSDSDNTLALSLEPKLVTTYQGQHLQSAITLSHAVVRQNSDLDNSDKNFTDATLASSLELIDNVLRLSVNAQQNYRTISQGDNLISDKLLASGELSKTKSYAAALNFVTPNPSWIGLDWQAGLNQTKAEQALDSNFGLDSKVKNISVRAYNGKRLDRVTFDLNASYNDISRANLQNYNTTTVSGNVGIPLSSQFKLMVLGDSSKYGFDEESTASFQTRLDTTSYGAGLRWSPIDKKFIELSYNQLDEDNQKTNYVGVNLNWAFSSRTALAFNYRDSFYGETYNANLTYALKHLRLGFAYNESVNTFAQTRFSTNFIGLFVCPVGNTDLAVCYQPESPSYIPEVDEEYVSFSSRDADIFNQINLNKSGNLSIAYSKRKINVSLTLTHSNALYLETDRERTNKAANFTFSYALGRNTKLGFNASANDTSGEQGLNQTTESYSTRFDRTLSKQASVNVSLRYVNRDSENDERDITDKRLSLGFNYTF
jgi:uncharacterized protein (PEP-CTERM system associated)